MPCVRFIWRWARRRRAYGVLHDRQLVAASDGVLLLPRRHALPPERQGFYLIDPQGNQLLFYADTLGQNASSANWPCC
jgi:hypothetical protein